METKLIECNLSRCDPNLPIGLWLGYEIGLSEKSENAKFARRLVINVEPGSLAEHAGFKVGDKVIEIDGKKTNGLTNKEISCLVQSTGDINFVVERISPFTK